MPDQNPLNALRKATSISADPLDKLSGVPVTQSVMPMMPGGFEGEGGPAVNPAIDGLKDLYKNLYSNLPTRSAQRLAVRTMENPQVLDMLKTAHGTPDPTNMIDEFGAILHHNGQAGAHAAEAAIKDMFPIFFGK